MKGTSWRGIRVRLGDYNMHINDGTEQEFRIQKLVKHPLYRNRSHLADLALIKLDRQANTASRYVQTICLPNTNTKPFNGSDYCFVTGWGDTRGKPNYLFQIKLKTKNSTLSEHLQSQNRKIIKIRSNIDTSNAYIHVTVHSPDLVQPLQ